MTSGKQFRANRANAKKSTGPRTQAGKARSRLNARKHGLTAKLLIVGGECAEDFEQLRAQLMEEHDPQTALEDELVERLAGILWRLRRVPFFEAAILDARQAQLDNNTSTRSAVALRLQNLTEDEDSDEVEDDQRELSDEEWSVRVGDALIQDGVFGDALGKLARHETTLMNNFTKTLQALVLLQERRNHQKGTLLIDAVNFDPQPKERLTNGSRRLSERQ